MAQEVMTKRDLVDAVARDTDLTKTQAAEAIDALLNAIKGALRKRSKVQITGFGTFDVKKSAARTAVKPGTDEKVAVPARWRPKFTAGSQLKDAVK